MKMIKISAIFGALLASTTLSSGATVNISAGLPSQGITVTSNSLAVTNFVVAVGSWDGATFTQFGNSFVDDAKINGQIIAVAPTSVNGLAVHLFVGSGATVAESRQFIIFSSSNASTLFPADVTGTGSVTFAATLGANLVTKSATDAEIVGNTVNFTAVPEPSIALLGALGVLGLVRRRR